MPHTLPSPLRRFIETDKEQLIVDCRAALDGQRDARNVREVVARAVADPATVLRRLGEPKRGGIEELHRSPELTIINVLWPAGQVIMPHNHAMWAVIGVYTGREDNILWRRLPDDINGRIEAAGAKTLGTKDVLSLGADAIHSVVNPLSRLTGAIHVYGGSMAAASLVSRAANGTPSHSMNYNMEKVLRMFAQ